jgi:hypothetical protein
LLKRLRRKPLELLPERSVDSVARFLSGYSMFGGPVWQELARFEVWLANAFYWPLDVGKWDRFIQLNSADGFESYKKFFSLYSRFVREVPDVTPEPQNSKFELDPDKFDFFEWLYHISRRPSMYFGDDGSVKALAAYLAGFFAGKHDRGLSLSRDEKEFLRFENWLWRTYDFKRRYPWYRLIELWPRNNNSAASFFDEFDAFLTDFGKKPRGLKDLFEVVKNDRSTRIQRRRRIPKRVAPVPNPVRWWRRERRNS